MIFPHQPTSEPGAAENQHEAAQSEDDWLRCALELESKNQLTRRHAAVARVGLSAFIVIVLGIASFFFDAPTYASIALIILGLVGWIMASYVRRTLTKG